MSDMPRYREAYMAMANGVLRARKEAGVTVLVGGTDSTSNALDKLFSDGKDTFSPILGLTFSQPDRAVDFNANQTKDIVFSVTSGQPVATNTYALSASFTAVRDGTVTHVEDLHCNVIAHRTIAIDGNMSDWAGVLPQIISAVPTHPSLSEQALFPFRASGTVYDASKTAAYLAYDEKNFYFAAVVDGASPDNGTLRFANRLTDPHFDDQFFFPETFYTVVTDNNGNVTSTTEQHWSAGVRRYDYRKIPVLPAGNGMVNFDNILIAFNVIPEDDAQDKGMPDFPPGTMPHYNAYKDTDYEYALNQVAPENGGGTEIYRLLVPGMPRKMFYPREPVSPFDGAVTNGQLYVATVGGQRITEAAIPWSEIPWAKKRLDAGQTIKFSFRVNDKRGSGYELADSRSVSLLNPLTFRCDWVQHWSNEVEFGFAK
jgi:hypothetical protein